MRNYNNEFKLIIYVALRKMANFEPRELEIGLEFGLSSFTKHNNFSEGSSEPKKYAQVIRVRVGQQPQEFFNSNHLSASLQIGSGNTLIFDKISRSLIFSLN